MDRPRRSSWLQFEFGAGEDAHGSLALHEHSLVGESHLGVAGIFERLAGVKLVCDNPPCVDVGATGAGRSRRACGGVKEAAVSKCPDGLVLADFVGAVRFRRGFEQVRRAAFVVGFESGADGLQGIDRMSRPQKIHKPIKAPFNTILGAVAAGHGKGKAAAAKLARAKQDAPKPKEPNK